MRKLRLISTALIVLFAASTAFAVSAEEKDFVILGRTVEDHDGNSILAGEMVQLHPAPEAVDIVSAELKSGTVVYVIQKVELGTGEVWYNVSTVGPGGGIMGWVNEDYIYEITSNPLE